VNLRDSGLSDSKDSSHFFHREFFKVVEGQDLVFAMGEFSDGLFKKAAHFRTDRKMVGIFLIPRGTILRG